MRGLRRLQELAVEFCSCPSAQGPLSALRATPEDATGIPCFAPPCAGYDACKNLQLSFVLARQLKDLFRPYGAPSPCAEKARNLLRSCSAEKQELERRDVFRLETHSDCPQGWDPIRKALRAGCRNAAAGGETSSLLAACWGTFSCALKPEYIPQRLRFALVRGLRRLQELTGKYCPCPSVHGPLPPLRGPPSPCAGKAWR